MAITITILGSGSSTGVPVIGCRCPVCSSSHPYNQRLRSSLFIFDEDRKEGLIIDTSPDFRRQILNLNSPPFLSVLYTHMHADHSQGFDDLRALSFASQQPVQCYLSCQHQDELRSRFFYAFEDTGYHGMPPTVELHTLSDNQPFEAAGFTITPHFLPHGNTMSTAFQFGSFLYATDFISFPPEVFDRLSHQVTTMIASGLRYRPHPTHSSISETLELMEKIGVKKGVLTHTTHDVDFDTLTASLPEWASMAYDGMSLSLDRF